MPALCAALFLEQQFERLSEKNIPLYWAAGPRDPVWDEALDVVWSKNIRVFPRTHAETLHFERHGVPLVRFIGRSGEASAWHLNDHVVTESQVFTIGLGLIPPAQPDGKRWDVDYWCLHGGATANKRAPTPDVPNVSFHDCGTPQGRNFFETGIHGCSLISIGEDRKVRIRECAADKVRYLDETISLSSKLERKAFEAAIRKRAESAHEQNPTVVSFARWTIDTDDGVLPPVVWDEWLFEITAQLRRDFGGGNHPLWTTELRILPSTIPQDSSRRPNIVGRLPAIVERAIRSRRRKAFGARNAGTDRGVGRGIKRISGLEQPSHSSPHAARSGLARHAVVGNRGGRGMNITDVEITGFGIWKNLRVENLSPGLTVFYGPNEAGKSTIMQFMRAMLYGFTPGRRAKYLPPVFGGKAGGRLSLHRDRETWNVRRLEDAGLGALTLHGPDDHEYGEAQLKALLGDVDEGTYNNVFSLSLHELQELSTLQETDAGRLLYEMSAGLDRVSLGDVLRELSTSRGRLMIAGDKPSQITDLMSQRDRLRGELDALAAGWRGRRRLSEEKSELERAVTAAQQEQTILANELRTAEAAWSLRDMRRARAELNEQLNSIGPTDNVPSDAVERMDNANSILRRCKIRRRKLIKKRDAIRKQYDAIQLNANLWKQCRASWH
ncbi:MAG: AAA family ATPase [Pirellulales bacterium]